MAQGKIQIVDFGDDLEEYVVAADATVLGGDDIWIIVGDVSGMTRDQVAEALERARLRILNPEITPFPLA